MSLNSPPLSQNETSLQPFNALPDELLLSVFQCLDPLKRSLLLPICKKWNDALLVNHSLWNSLILEKNRSFEESLSILRLFNSRSGYKLKHICLNAEVPDDESLKKLFEELGKSSESLRVLSVVSEFPENVIMRQAKKNSPKLNTLHLITTSEYRPTAIPRMFSCRKRLGIQDSEDENLKYLRCGDLSSVGEEYEDYLSNLKNLCIQGSCSVTALRSMLWASRSILIDLNLLTWLPSSSPLSTSGKGKICLENLQSLHLPFIEEALKSLDETIEVEGKLNKLGGFLSSLVEFNYPAVKHLAVRLDVEEMQLIFMETEDPERTAALFQRYNSIEELTFWCPRSKTAGKKHLDFLLKTLLSSRSKVEVGSESSESDEEEEKPGSQEGKEIFSSAQQKDSQPEIPLPNLVKLTIRNPVNLDGHSLWELWKVRKNVRDDFKVRIKGDEGNVEVNDWEARGWTD